jgi:hypothetical protein
MSYRRSRFYGGDCAPGFKLRKAYCVTEKCVRSNTSGLDEWRSFFNNYREEHPKVPFREAQKKASIQWKTPARIRKQIKKKVFKGVTMDYPEDIYEHEQEQGDHLNYPEDLYEHEDQGNLNYPEDLYEHEEQGDINYPEDLYGHEEQGRNLNYPEDLYEEEEQGRHLNYPEKKSKKKKRKKFNIPKLNLPVRTMRISTNLLRPNDFSATSWHEFLSIYRQLHPELTFQQAQTRASHVWGRLKKAKTPKQVDKILDTEL